MVLGLLVIVLLSGIGPVAAAVYLAVVLNAARAPR